MPSTEDTLRSLEALANVMDNQFRMPGTNIRLGLDAIIGLIPVVGDTASLGVSFWFVFRAARLGVRKRTLLTMVFNVFMDWLIGLIPLIGDIFDVGWKGNMRNVAVLRRSFPDIQTL